MTFTRNILIKSIGNIVSLFCVVFVLWLLFRHVNQLSYSVISVKNVLLTIAMICLYTVSLAAAIYAWQGIVLALGVKLSYVDAYIISGKAQIAKYLPGNIVQYLSKFAIGKTFGVSYEAMAVSVGIETIINVVVSVIFVCVGFILDENKFNAIWAISNSNILHLNGIVIMMSAILALLIITYLCRERFNIKREITLGLVVKPTVVTIVNLIIFAVFAWCYSNAIISDYSKIFWPRFLWGFFISWVFGFFMPGAPGGIGVREATMVVVWGEQIGASNAAIIAIYYRIISTCADILNFLIAKSASYRKQLDL